MAEKALQAKYMHTWHIFIHKVQVTVSVHGASRRLVPVQQNCQAGVFLFGTSEGSQMPPWMCVGGAGLALFWGRA